MALFSDSCLVLSSSSMYQEMKPVKEVQREGNKCEGIEAGLLL